MAPGLFTMQMPDVTPVVYRCAGPSCPGLPYRASERAHPESCLQEPSAATTSIAEQEPAKAWLPERAREYFLLVAAAFVGDDAHPEEAMALAKEGMQPTRWSNDEVGFRCTLVDVLRMKPDELDEAVAWVRGKARELPRSSPTAADEAVDHLLRRVQTDADLAWLISPVTECFSLLCQAVAERTGKKVAAVVADVIAGVAHRYPRRYFTQAEHEEQAALAEKVEREHQARTIDDS